ncbi:MAG: hypothetical protein AMXMBFR33_61620 [Candidatus Xenobia bacterium]
MFLLLLSPAWAREGVALVVGQESYHHLSDLEHARSDARLLAEALRAGGFEVDLLEEADRATFGFRLARLASGARSDEPVVVAFFGHSLGGYLMLSDSHPGQLEQSALSAETLYRSLSGLRVLVLLDAWRNEPVEALCCSDNRLTAEVARRFGGALFACSPGQRAFDWSERGHGFFAYYLAEAIRAGKRSGEALAEYLRARVDRDCRRVMLQSQRPFLGD